MMEHIKKGVYLEIMPKTGDPIILHEDAAESSIRSGLMRGRIKPSNRCREFEYIRGTDKHGSKQHAKHAQPWTTIREYAESEIGRFPIRVLFDPVVAYGQMSALILSVPTGIMAVSVWCIITLTSAGVNPLVATLEGLLLGALAPTFFGFLFLLYLITEWHDLEFGLLEGPILEGPIEGVVVCLLAGVIAGFAVGFLIGAMVGVWNTKRCPDCSARRHRIVMTCGCGHKFPPPLPDELEEGRFSWAKVLCSNCPSCGNRSREELNYVTRRWYTEQEWRCAKCAETYTARNYAIRTPLAVYTLLWELVASIGSGSD